MRSPFSPLAKQVYHPMSDWIVQTSACVVGLNVQQAEANVTKSSFCCWEPTVSQAVLFARAIVLVLYLIHLLRLLGLLVNTNVRVQAATWSSSGDSAEMLIDWL